MAIQLYEGHNLCLSKLILGSIYESVGYEGQMMQAFPEGKTLALSGLCGSFNCR